jgi:hypothetical protein
MRTSVARIAFGAQLGAIGCYRAICHRKVISQLIKALFWGLGLIKELMQIVNGRRGKYNTNIR